MPQAKLSQKAFEAGYNAADLFFDAGLCPNKSESRRLIQQGGAFVSDKNGVLAAIGDIKTLIYSDCLDGEGCLVLRAGKKRYCLVRT